MHGISQSLSMATSIAAAVPIKVPEMTHQIKLKSSRSSQPPTSHSLMKKDNELLLLLTENMTQSERDYLGSVLIQNSVISLPSYLSTNCVLL